MGKFWLATIGLFLSPSLAWAFPEMIRHGYTSCMACHVSASGGGLLTPYGRSIAHEVLSRWSYSDEESLAHGAIPETTRSWIDGSRERGFNVGGDLRFLQTRTETQTARQGRFIPMQRDLEFAAQWHGVSLVANYGLIFDPQKRDRLQAKRVYLNLNLSDRVVLRMGRFTPTYGIMLSDHYLSVRQGAALGLSSERLAIEAHLTNEKWSAFANLSRADGEETLRDERAGAFGLNWNPASTYRLGFNYWYGSHRGGKRDMTGVHALLGFSKSLYALIQVDLQVDAPDAEVSSRGLRHFERSGFEVAKGVHLLAQVDGAQTDLSKSATKFVSPGLGISFYPRPHFEFQFMYSRPKYEGRDSTDSAFFLTHYYL